MIEAKAEAELRQATWHRLCENYDWHTHVKDLIMNYSANYLIIRWGKISKVNASGMPLKGITWGIDSLAWGVFK